ncbi:hypothetical protein Slin14017_G098800 [Septoria linicola]|nr:hypothetical protein Slin14017_G098800 [Septoria linicola]
MLKENNLLPVALAPTLTSDVGRVQPPVTLRLGQSATSDSGRFVSEAGQYRYMSSNLWDNIGEDEVHQTPDEEDVHSSAPAAITGHAGDPFSMALTGPAQSLLQYHPSHAHARLLWRAHVENVEPLCKILHVPTVSDMLARCSSNPAVATKAEECLLFAVYHFAILSLEDAECMIQFGASRSTLLQRYHFCVRQALVTAGFLKTAEMMIMQAYVLFLLSCRSHYDPPTFWILTGVAVRIAQRMGLHRDGEAAALPPFEVQMRRRLFYQIIPLDGMASRESGVGIGLLPDQFDTLPPTNVNDSELWPSMTTQPVAHKGATEMVFCLARAYIGRSFNASKQFKDDEAVHRMIAKTEDEVEDMYLRYCEFANPLHLLTNLATRSALNAMRLRIRLPRLNDRPDTEEHRRERLQLSVKILDTDAAAHSHSNLKKYMWYIRPFFAWGTWDSLISVLSALPQRNSLSRSETDNLWEKVQAIYTNHDETLKLKQPLQVAIGRLTLKAWDANPPSASTPEPEFIAAFRASKSYQYRKKHNAGHSNDVRAPGEPKSDVLAPAENDNAVEVDQSPNFGFDFGDLLDNDSMDWVFWDNLIKDYQAQGS